mmetsp:Transcript_9879/g.11165  ORF Transcript_9879/g.11165 Transcript_9879/m.11165 type:complete len:192 (-) Transcript_9879:28-603(-)
MGQKLPGRIQSLEKSAALPSPFHYTVKTDSVLPGKYKKVGFGYGDKSNKKSAKMSPGPGEYNLTSFTDKFRPSFYRMTRRSQEKRSQKSQRSMQPTPRDCSLAKPLSGGVFDPMGVVTKKGTVGFNYPPLKPPKYFQTGNTLFYKTDGFKNGGKKFGNSLKGIRDSQVIPSSNNQELPEMGTNSEASSISK